MNILDWWYPLIIQFLVHVLNANSREMNGPHGPLVTWAGRGSTEEVNDSWAISFHRAHVRWQLEVKAPEPGSEGKIASCGRECDANIRR